jgi:hypothetical protein
VPFVLLCGYDYGMAFTVEDLNDLIELLRQHPEWREAVRREVLTRELLELPLIVERLADRLDQLATRTDQLAVRMDQLVAEMLELATITRRLDGRVGNLEGWRYEQKFNALSRVTEILRKPALVQIADIDPVLDARDEGRLSPTEWKQLVVLDFLFRGRVGKGVDAPESFVALEVSQVVDSRDVQRAHDRAAILTRLGLKAIPAVGGSRLTDDASMLAEQLGVRTLIDAPDQRAADMD